MDKKKVLIVDDDPAIRKFIGANLIARGYQVQEAENGLVALDFLQKEDMQLILLDIMMPELDGFEVCRRIRNTSNVPILMLSAREGETDIDRCAACGANEYITKPFVLRELLTMIQGLIG